MALEFAAGDRLLPAYAWALKDGVADPGPLLEQVLADLAGGRTAAHIAARFHASLAHLALAWVDEHASSWEAGERFGLHGDRSGRLDSLAAALLLEQWLRDGPEPDSGPS